MSYLLDAIQIVLLAFMAIEMALLRRELTNSRTKLPRDSDETGSKGQTINVNVGTPVVGEAGIVTKTIENVLPPAPAPESEAVEETPPPIDERAQRAAERARMDSAIRATPSGLMVKKCPSCGMENTAYRSECFNCGAGL